MNEWLSPGRPHCRMHGGNDVLHKALHLQSEMTISSHAYASWAAASFAVRRHRTSSEKTNRAACRWLTSIANGGTPTSQGIGKINFAHSMRSDGHCHQQHGACDQESRDVGELGLCRIGAAEVMPRVVRRRADARLAWNVIRDGVSGVASAGLSRRQDSAHDVRRQHTLSSGMTADKGRQLDWSPSIKSRCDGSR